ncbi:hypothetical protein [Flagellimonas eckloniae]|uniref:hypothetical protein n=1 Tax=Flagellimonas eckloniae TaxID=346185 RepID=UPI0006DCB2C6|nr:hypothetical protein [Allomuricauda eckloniae]
MYDSIFNIDFNRFVGSLVPIKRRTTKMLHWLVCLVHPIAELHIQFLQYRDRTNYKLEHTAQVFSIEKVLNDTFDTVQRRIVIEDGVYTLPVWFYDRNDDKPVRFDDRANNQPVRFYDRASLAQFDEDFKVVLPNGLNLSNPEMIRLKALVDFYKLPDKTYTVSYG